MKKRLIFITVIVLLVGVGILVYQGQQKTNSKADLYSGVVEATRSQLSFQVSGRVVQVYVEEGSAVRQNEMLAELDDAEYRAGVDQARANMETAVNRVIQLESVLSLYEKTLPADVARAKAGVESACAVLEEARRDRDRYASLLERNVVSPRDWEAVVLHFETSRARRAEAEAVLRQAESNLQRLDTAKKEINVARAQLQAARAALEAAEIRLRQTRLRAPFDGIITSRNIEPGEVVAPSREVLTLSDLSTVELKIFVDETRIGTVKPGQAVDITIDTFPGKIYRGTVSYISPEGEFTPKVIQTHKERVKLVYLVKVLIPNPDLELKTGMPADATLK